MDGILNFNKPVGISSAKTLYRVRGITGIRKSGHAGTLDPLAEGVLVLGLGKGAKLCEAVMDQPKVYESKARLDVTSASFDLEQPLLPVPIAGVPSAQEIAQAARRLEGRIMQSPPAFSAIKSKGRPMYRLARKGGDSLDPIPERPVTVYWLVVRGYVWPEVEFELCCGRGTYVRSLIRDWGRLLGVGGCLTWLRRSAVGPFKLADSADFESLERQGLERGFVPFDAARCRLTQEIPDVPPRPAPP